MRAIRRHRAGWRARTPERDAVGTHAGEWCGLSTDERAALVALERTLAQADPALSLRLSRARARRLRAWLLSPGGTAAGASLLGIGAIGAVWSAWFGLLLFVGSLPAVVDVVETRRLHRVTGEATPTHRSSEWT